MDDEKIRQLMAVGEEAVIYNEQGQIEAALIRFDGPEGKGRIVVERGGYGLYVWVEGYDQPLCLVDLFYYSREHHKADASNESTDHA